MALTLGGTRSGRRRRFCTGNFRGLSLYRRPSGAHCLNQLAKGCTRHRVKHPLAKGLVKVEIKTYYEETITRGVSNYQVLLQVIPQGLSTRASFTRPPRSTMVIIRRGLFTQASPTRPLLSTFEELLVEEEQAKEAALK